MLFYILSLLIQLIFPSPSSSDAPYLVVLGVAQDAGYPQSDCRKDCCKRHWEGNAPGRKVTSLGLVDPATDRIWMIDATPDFREQLHMLQSFRKNPADKPLDGIFLTHAHIGHYTGLAHLGREVMGAREAPVYAMPRMKDFLETNGPWDQLVRLENIAIWSMRADSAVMLSDELSVMPLVVPHRDEYSETVGFRIAYGKRSILFIPDIDKWEKWDRDIREEIRRADAVLIDGTFFRNGELPGRDMSEIPHPFVEETATLLKSLTSEEKAKVHFIHFNHTNPLLWDEASRHNLISQGFRIAAEGQILHL